MKKRNNAGPRKFKAPKRKQATSQQQRYLSAKTKVFRVSPGKKGSLRNPNILFIKKSQQKKTSSSGKGHDSYFFGPNITSKKVWVPIPRFQKKMYEFQKKSSPKKGIHTFWCQT